MILVRYCLFQHINGNQLDKNSLNGHKSATIVHLRLYHLEWYREVNFSSIIVSFYQQKQSFPPFCAALKLWTFVSTKKSEAIDPNTLVWREI